MFTRSFSISLKVLVFLLLSLGKVTLSYKISALLKSSSIKVQMIEHYNNVNKFNSISKTLRLISMKIFQQPNADADWKSGAIFKNKSGGRPSNNPWWMSEDEKNNPRILPVFHPWWAVYNPYVNNSWKLPELRKEAARRQLPTSEKKDQLIEMLQKSTIQHSLNDDAFILPVYVEVQSSNLPPCYPDTYEDPQSIEELRKMAAQIPAPK